MRKWRRPESPDSCFSLRGRTVVGMPTPSTRPADFESLRGRFRLASVALLPFLFCLSCSWPDDSTYNVSVENDTHQPVGMAMCRDLHCSELANELFQVTPGESYDQNVVQNARVSFWIVTPSGAKSCRMLSVGREVERSYLLSSLEPCP
jgi:hypothetical protein